MNYNANAGPRQPLGRKIKRVSDVKAMGVTIPVTQPQQPAFTPYNQPMQYPNGGDYNPSPYTAGYSPQYIPNQYQMPGTPNSAPYIPPQGPQVPQQAFSVLSQPVVQDMALQYGQQLANTGKQMVKTELERYVPVSRIKYYFAVDTRYVMNKIRLLFFPFTHKDWSIKYEQDSPVQPRFEINAPDLYIPTMAYVTYVLVAGLVLGMQKRFTPEQIGIQASSALAWCLVEMAIYTATLYITNIQTTLRTLDLLAYSGYKYVGIITSILLSIVFEGTGYYSGLAYCSLALAFFLVRSLKAQVLPESNVDRGQYYGDAPQVGSKRRLYFLLFVAVTQPLLSWWLSFHLIGSSAKIVATAAM